MLPSFSVYFTLVTAIAFSVSQFACLEVLQASPNPDCEAGFIETRPQGAVQSRWRLAKRDLAVIDQTDRLLKGEFENRLPSDVYEVIRVQDYSLLRFSPERIALFELRTKDSSRAAAHFRLFNAGALGKELETLPFFEAIHFEAAKSRAWRRLSSVTTVNIGFSSQLRLWQLLYGEVANQAEYFGRPIFEISRLLGEPQHAAILSDALSKHQQQNPRAIYFAYAKTPEQVKLYETLLGFTVFESFENPRTGNQEFFLQRYLLHF